MALTPGTRLGPYQVTAKIGEGGMGEVYQARDTKLDRDVALKVLPEAFTADPDRLARFEREAKVLASLNHPNIGSIYGLEEADGVKALVLELVEGPTLADRIKQGPIPIDETLPIAKQIAEALEAAHERGVIHRDLKPANIKVKDDGTVKVLDFGLAKALQPDAGSDPSESPTISLTAAATQMGMVIGTAAYMAPEQAKGKAIDKRADVWAFGAVLYEMLTGTRVFAGGDVSDTLAYVLTKEIDWTTLPATMPTALRHLLRRCLERDPKRRLRDIGDAWLELEDPRVTEATQPPAAGATPHLRVWQRPLVIVLIVAGIAALSSVAVWTLRRPAPRAVARTTISIPATQALAFATETSIAITPDGSHVIYRATVDNQSALFVRPMEALEATRLPGLSGPLRAPFISPDGGWVGFFGSRTIEKVTIRGGPPIAICELPGGTSRGASWGPDDTIVFATSNPETGLWRVSAGGGEPEQLTIPNAEQGEFDHVAPYFLPSGDAVLFAITSAGGPDTAQIALLSLDTGQVEVLIPGGSGPRYVASGHIVYAAAGTLRAVGFDLDRREVTSDPFPVLDDVRAAALSGAAEIAVADNGTLVYVRGSAGESIELTWVDRDGREEPIGADAAAYLDPKLSPDGTKVALRILANDGMDLFVYDLARNNLSRLTFAPEGNCCPLWSPDGERILFASTRAAGPANLYQKNADGTGEVERLTESPRHQIPFTWSPDGETVLFYGAGSVQMLTMDVERTTSSLFQAPGTTLQFALSPDGRWLAYQSNENGRFDIYVRPFPDVDGGIWKVSASGGQYPVWSADGSEIFFLAGDSVMAVPITAGEKFIWDNPTVLFRGAFSADDPIYRSYDVASDGHFLMRKRSAARSGGVTGTEMVAVFNWFEELKARVPVN